ncbi:MAG TPA: 2-dehydropantoate 2-reductase [Solirubrobacteraceae bacterium]|jgi:2-dehydropantoate 2-reductase|nr:2-dehydropantoate 2-reductase [Solirubrobacteraceae bacterium]
MRFVVFGAGAVGGVVAARLHQGGFPVTVIARGAHLEAIRRDGLTLLTPSERTVLALSAAADPAEVDWDDEDVVLLVTKSQDTLGALTGLRDAAGSGVPVVCVQNGVENERVALRLMDHVYGAVVMAPTAHLEPGVVESYGADRSGEIDVGCYPDGVDERCERICAALEASMFNARPMLDVMRLKYAKLLLNLSNAVRALCDAGEDRDELVARVQDEGRAVLTAAAIDFVADEVSDVTTRWAQWGVRDIDGRKRAGSSTWQSLARGTGALETDYLNGEIVLQGRLVGVPAPVNEALCRLAARAAREGRRPGSLRAADILAVAA